MVTPYSTLQGFLKEGEYSWVSEDIDRQRLQSYELYDQIYWTVPDALKISLRGTEDRPIFVPSARTIVEAANRFVGTNLIVSLGDQNTEVVQAATLAMGDLFKRERFHAKYSSAKRYNLIQGDWIWHITADPGKPQGTRMSLQALAPSLYFPVWDKDDLEKLVAVHLAHPIEDPDDNNKVYIQRQTYRKVFEKGVTVGITVESGWFETEDWESLEAVPKRIIREQEMLPFPIKAIPVYHIRNFEEPGNPFGCSELRGLERLTTSINQTITDEELTLALEGIGMYVTDAGQPVDKATGEPVPWQLGPGRVLHHPPDTNFRRITGVSSVSPYGDHYNRVWEGLQLSSSTPDIAIGRVDVATAQSGVALSLRMSPMITKAEEKNNIIRDGHQQMLYDIFTMWYPAYESSNFEGINPEVSFGSAIPVNRAERFAELGTMLDKEVIDTKYYREEATKLGYVFPSNIGSRVERERKAKMDDFGSRLDSETESIVDSAEVKSRSEAMGTLIRAGVAPEDAARQVGLSVSFLPGLRPVTLKSDEE